MALQFADDFSVLGLVDGDLLLGGHEELVAAAAEPHKAGRLPHPAIEAPPAADQIEHPEAFVGADGQRQSPRGVDGEVVDPLPVDLHRSEEHERIGIVDADEAVFVAGDEVAREREVLRGEERERRDGGAMVEKRAEGGGGGEVVEVDGVVGAAGGRGVPAGSDAGNGGGVGGVGEERG